jgi:hypothetical protein
LRQSFAILSCIPPLKPARQGGEKVIHRNYACSLKKRIGICANLDDPDRIWSKALLPELQNLIVSPGPETIRDEQYPTLEIQSDLIEMIYKGLRIG